MTVVARPATDGYERLAISAATMHAMVASGLIEDPARIELLEGDLITMAPTHLPHARMVARLIGALANGLPDDLEVVDAVSLQLDAYNEPVPDICILHAGVEGEIAQAKDVALVIEVSAATARKDRMLKAPLYARAGIPELWIIDLDAAEVLMHRAPGPDGWGDVRTSALSEPLSPICAPGLVVSASD